MNTRLAQLFIFFSCSLYTAYSSYGQEKLIYHEIKTDDQGNILPWYEDDPGISYDHIVKLVFDFWHNMRRDYNGLPYYMNHQVWRDDMNDPRGLGGDQLNMALSSWGLLYAYTGNEKIKTNMAFMADYYLAHSLSSPECEWPNVPYPYNTSIYSGYYDGDMVIGKGYFQPDKAGSFGIELVKMYKMWSQERAPNESYLNYLRAAIKIANTLADHIQPGDYDNSPMPFKVHAETGEIGPLKHNNRKPGDAGLSSYTSNWTGILYLFESLIELGEGDIEAYKKGKETIIKWMKEYPMKNNRWGPFFEDIPGWSDTQINAMTWTRYMMLHREEFPNWENDIPKIIEWVYETMGNEQWKKYGVTVVNEQTVYQTPGNSHTSRQAADELLFYSLTRQEDKYTHCIRQLNWATYMVDHDGKNRYPRDENWLTDGYGDYVRHYLRAMAAVPEIAPDADHLLSSTSVVMRVDYGNVKKYLTPLLWGIDYQDITVSYQVFDDSGMEVLRLKEKPKMIHINGQPIKELNQLNQQGFTWKPLEEGGILTIKRTNGVKVGIFNKVIKKD